MPGFSGQIFYLQLLLLLRFFANSSNSMPKCKRQNAHANTPSHTHTHSIIGETHPWLATSVRGGLRLRRRLRLELWSKSKQMEIKKAPFLVDGTEIGHPLVGRLFQANRVGRKCIMWNWARKYHTFPHALSFKLHVNVCECVCVFVCMC